MDLVTFKMQVQDIISKTISLNSPGNYRKMIEYAVLPPGKMIRPALIWACCVDQQNPITNEHLKLAASIEIHHAYTLVHDDLPDMDNDDFRRGRPSHHRMFNPALAILTGDVLLALSFKLLSEVNNKNLQNLYFWATGAKGLINGQILDLDSDKKTLDDIIRVFELKTARLFQLAFLGSTLISKSNKANYQDYLQNLRLGSYLGVLFQVCDDQDDYKNGKEDELNIFKNYHDEALKLKETVKNNIKLKYHHWKETLDLFEKYLN